MINLGCRIIVAGGLAAAGLLAVPAVSAAASDALTVESLASSLDSSLRTRPGFADLWQVTCNGGLQAVEGASQRCVAVKMDGARFAVDVHLVKLAPRTVDYNYSVTPLR